MLIVTPEQLPATFQRNLRYWRKAKPMTIRALGEALGTSDSAIVNWENGKTSPTLTTVVRIAQALGITPEALLMDSTPSSQDVPLATAG